MTDDEVKSKTIADDLDFPSIVQSTKDELSLLVNSVLSGNTRLFESISDNLTLFLGSYPYFREKLINSLNRDEVIAISRAAIQFVPNLYVADLIPIADFGNTSGSEYVFSGNEERWVFCLSLSQRLQSLLARFERADYPKPSNSGIHDTAIIVAMFKNGPQVADLSELSSGVESSPSADADRSELAHLSLATFGLFPFPREYIKEIILQVPAI